MKRYSFYLAAVLLASIVSFTSCGKDDPPSITVKLDNQQRNEITVLEGETVSVEFSYKADAGIKQIEITSNGTTVHSDFPKTSGFSTTTSHTERFTLGPVWIEAANATTGSATYVTTITDVNGNTEEESITITVNTGLAAEQSFSLAWTGSTVIDAERGIRGSVDQGRFWVNSTTQGESLVQVSEQAYNSVRSKGRIRLIYNNAPASDRFSFIAPDLNAGTTFPTPLYFISKTGNDNYYLIKWTGITADFVNFTGATAHMAFK
jgi:hypothetical protein